MYRSTIVFFFLCLQCVIATQDSSSGIIFSESLNDVCGVIFPMKFNVIFFLVLVLVTDVLLMVYIVFAI